MKDVPGELAPGLVIAAIPAREVPNDVLISAPGHSLETLPQQARVGTSSLRRMALLRSQRRDLEVVALRGNVDTRLGKLAAGELDAVVHAAAGLRRLGVTPNGAITLPLSEFLPSIGQGALAVETRRDQTVGLFDTLNHPASAVAVDAERAFLRRVGGSCRTPLAAYARVEGAELRMEALIAAVDGREIIRGNLNGRLQDAESLGQKLADEILERGGRRILDALGESAHGG
jgi:hydroxymethylbilane synthase